MHVTRRRALATAGASLFAPHLATGSAPLAAATASSTRAFLRAVCQGDLPRVRRMLRADPSLARAADADGRSAFVLAHLAGADAVAEHLRATGTLSLDVVEAVLAGDWPRVDQLVAADPACLRRAHPVGGTPLYAAALIGRCDLWRLRGAGCLPDAAPPGGSGFTPARGAVDSPREVWARIALADLLANGGDPNAAQRDGDSVLHGAVRRRSELLLRLAVRKGCATDAVDSEGRTPRDLAAEIGWQAGADLLAGHAALPRDHRASRFALDANREPVQRLDLADVPQALQSEVTASSHLRLDRLRELVDRDRRLVWSISTDDELAIEASAHLGNRPAIRFHLDHGAPLSLPTAVALGDLEAIDFWLRRDPLLVHERGAHDFPLMHYAAFGGGDVAVAERLLGHGVPVDQDSVGTTALHWCARLDRRDHAAWLLEQGADRDAVGYRWHRDGQTPRQVAVARGHADLAAMLTGSARCRRW